jgi:hypothetical protein
MVCPNVLEILVENEYEVPYYITNSVLSPFLFNTGSWIFGGKAVNPSIRPNTSEIRVGVKKHERMIHCDLLCVSSVLPHDCIVILNLSCDVGWQTGRENSTNRPTQAQKLNTTEGHRPSDIKTKHQSDGDPQHGVTMATYTPSPSLLFVSYARLQDECTWLTVERSLLHLPP